ncbi:MAG: efflux transporter outer membrane subunit [Verrucomicrobiaceae bacterium]|nr:efflux transporter outer membrane subunit [Verrucomicrobiaceae bacterium]
MTRRAALALLGCQVLIGCTFIPKLNLPDAPVSPRYPGSGKTSAASSEIAWRKVFNDARLVRLIDIALANNRDLRIAMLRVEEARAQYRIERSALLPSVSQSSDFSRSHQSGMTSNQWQLNLGTSSYELDLFGHIRSLSAKALEQYFAKTEAQRAAQVTLVAELATQYYTMQQFEELIANTKLTLAAVEESYQLNDNIFKAGGLLELDLRSAETQVLTAKANLIAYQRQRDQAENGLVLMLGQPLPTNLPAGKSLADAPVKAVSAGVPSELLQGRPDIQEAERTLRAANADIGAARAAFFPSIKLTAQEGTVSTELTSLFSKGTAAWSFAPQITLPIFTGGRNRANLDAARIRTRIEIANYEKAIQSAFREVADALAAQRAAKERISTLQALVAAQQRRYDLAAARDQRGVSSYLNVVTAQQDLFSAQQNLISARYDAVTARIKLYQAVGGGWK